MCNGFCTREIDFNNRSLAADALKIGKPEFGQA